MVFTPEPGDVAHLGLHQQGYVVSHAGYRHQQPDVLVPGCDVPELQAEAADLLPQRCHHPEVASDGLQPQPLEPLPSPPGVQAVPIRRLDSLVCEDALDLRPLSEQEGPASHLLPELCDGPGRHVAIRQAVEPEQLGQCLGVDPVGLDAGLGYVPGLAGMGDGDLVSLLGQPSVEGCDAGGGFHGHLLHAVGFEEVGDFFVGHSLLGDDLAVWAEDGCVGGFLVDVQSTN